jgi:primosomal replication protein N
MTPLIHKQVTVNLNVTVDTSGQISIFGSSSNIIGNIIVAEYRIPFDTFYDPVRKIGLIEFWEPSDSINSIRCQLASSDMSSNNGHNLTDSYKYAARRIAEQFQLLLVNSFDCSGAIPFNKGIYKNISEYTTQRDFGRLVLSTYADKLFGHQAATAAIINDIPLMNSILSTTKGCDASGTAQQRFNNWNQLQMITDYMFDDWTDISQTSTDAKLAINITKKIIMKGLIGNTVITNTIDPSGNIVGNPSGASTGLGEIVKQVLGQDASRAMGYDNNELTPDIHQLLPLYNGDTIFISITIKTPQVSYSPHAANPGYSAQNIAFNNVTYLIKIVLDESFYTPIPTLVFAPTTAITTAINGYTIDKYILAKNGDSYTVGTITPDYTSSSLYTYGGAKPDTSSGSFLIKYTSSGSLSNNFIWLNNIPDLYDIITDSNSNLYIIGITSPNTVSLKKYNTSFSLDLDISLGDINTYKLYTDSNNNIYVTGNATTLSSDLNTAIGSKPITSDGTFLVKYDSLGNIQLSIWLNKPINNLIVDNNGNLFMYSGATTRALELDTAVFSMGIDNTKNIDIPDTQPYSLFSTDINLFTTSSTSRDTPLDSTIVKYDSAGNEVWTKSLDNTKYDIINTVTDSDGNIYSLGQAKSNFLTSDLGDLMTVQPRSSSGAFLVKYDTLGLFKWGVWIDGSTSTFNNNIRLDSNNIFVLCYTSTPTSLQSNIGALLGAKPSTSNGIFLVKYNLTGKAILANWINTYTVDSQCDIAIDSNHNVSLYGYITDLATNTTSLLTTMFSVQSTVSYAPITSTKGTAITPLSPTISSTGAIIKKYSASLPNGLIINSTTGVVSGTPTTISDVSGYTITINYEYGEPVITNLNIQVNDAEPIITYSNVSETVNNSISITPDVSGNVVSYSISPSLPAGLSFDTITGIISGTPANVFSTQYTVTANYNYRLSKTTTFTITINTPPPDNNEDNGNVNIPVVTYVDIISTKNTLYTGIAPTILYGPVSNFSLAPISPSLPAGLSINSTTGAISGTPTSSISNFTYIIKFSYNNGQSFSNASVNIKVNDVTPSISYSGPQTYTINNSINSVSPSVSGGATIVSYSISPSLLTGLSIDSTTGAISGTPTVTSGVTSYTITATNSTGQTGTASISITVNDVIPSINYSGPQTYTINSSINSVSPDVSGSPVSLTYSINPSLPTGLSIDSTTGAISGTPTVISGVTSYTVTATNSTGQTGTASISITVNDVTPSINYSGPQTYTINSSINSVSPDVSGSPVSLTYSISPSLPTGLSIDSTTGAISGTPTVTSGATSYSVTATNSTGQTSTATVNITVNDITPIISYSDITGKIAIAINTIQPTITQGAVSSYSISPSLPSGLAMDSSGNISGTPNIVLSTTQYTITATNSTGQSTIVVINVTIQDNLVPQWGKWLDGVGNDLGRDMTTDSLGNVYVTGFANNTLHQELTTIMGSKAGTLDGAFLIKYNSVGAPQWGKWLDGVGNDSGFSVKSDSLDNIYVSGVASNTLQQELTTIMGSKPGTTTNGAFLIKYNSIGTPLWGKWLDGIGNDAGRTIAIDSVNNVYIIGTANNTLQPELTTIMGSKPGTTTQGGFLIKYDSTGTLLWGRWLDGTSTDGTYGLITDVSNNIYVTGFAFNGSLQPELSTLMDSRPYSITQGAFLIKYDSTGTPLWGRWLDGTGLDSGTGIKTDSMGNIYVVAYVDSDLQSELSIIGSKPMGWTGTILIKYDSTGTPLWGRWIDGPGFDYGFGVDIDLNGNIYVVGYSTDNLQPELTAIMGSRPTTQSGINAVFLVKYNSDGIPQCGTWLDGSGSDLAYNVKIDSTGSVYVTGQVTTNLQPELTTLMGSKPNAATSTGAFLVKYNQYYINTQLPNVIYTPINNLKGTTITPVLPTIISGDNLITGYSISPPLPDGLVFDSTTGQISGTLPNVASNPLYYNIIVSCTTGQVITNACIIINDIVPVVSYSPITVFKGIASTGVAPTISSGNPISYSATLPAGLTINSVTGIISGTPTTITSSTAYTITITYTFGLTTTSTINITVNDIYYPIWGKWLDGSGTDDYGTSIACDQSGNSYVTGFATSALQDELVSLMGAKPSTLQAGFLVKYSPSGTPIWGKWLDGTGNDQGLYVQTDNSNNVYVAGFANSALQPELATLMGAKPGSVQGGILIKYNPDGVPLMGIWLDGTATEAANCISIDVSGNIYVTGHTTATLQASLTTLMGSKPGTTTQGAFLVKYNPSGAPQWGRWLDGSGIETGNSVATDLQGNVYVTGNATNTLQASLTTLMGSKPWGTTSGAYLVKYDTNGVAQWGKWIDGSGNDNSLFVATDLSGNIYVTGTTDILQTELTTLLGTKPNTISPASFLIKYNSIGNPLWGKWLDGTGTDTGYIVKTDSLGNVYVTGVNNGSFQGELTSIMGTKPSTLNGGFWIKYSINGTPLTGAWIDGTTGDLERGMALDPSGNIYVTGYTSGNLQPALIPIIGSKPATATTNLGAFVVKYQYYL